MRRSTFCLFIGLLFTHASVFFQPSPMQKGEELAPSLLPQIGIATAAEKKGEVVLQISLPSVRLTAKGDKSKGWECCWEDVQPLTLGKNVQAYSQAGKQLSKKAVLKTLAKQASVACFVQEHFDGAKEPDRAYTAVLRDDTVLLVVNSENLPTWGRAQTPVLAKGDKLAPALLPKFSKAIAAEKDGKVVVEFSLPELRFAIKDEKHKDGGMVYCWQKMKPQTLGLNINAYSPSGKLLNKEAVLKALAKQTPAICFVRVERNYPEVPDPVYTAVFRNDTVLLVSNY